MSDEQGEPCPIARAAGVVGDRWCLLILRNAMLGTQRFDQFKGSLGIADNVLSGRLSRLVDAGLLVREPYRDGGRVREQYRLTAAGLALHVVLEALGQWGQEQLAGSAGQGDRFEIRHTTCGQASAPGTVCTSCGAPLLAGDTAWRMPWLSDEPQPLSSART